MGYLVNYIKNTVLVSYYACHRGTDFKQEIANLFNNNSIQYYLLILTEIFSENIAHKRRQESKFPSLKRLKTSQVIQVSRKWTSHAIKK